MNISTISLQDYNALFVTLNAGINNLWLLVVLFTIPAALIIKSHDQPALPLKINWWLLMLVALVVRLPLMFRSLWYDETFTAAAARSSDLIAVMLADVHPPLHYAIISLLGRILGFSEFALRLPSLLVGLLLIWLVARLARRVVGDNAAFYAAWMAALLQAPIYYSVEARYPIFLTATVVGALICILENRSHRATVAVVLGVWFHATGMIYAGLFVLVFLYRRWWLQAVAVAIAATPVALLMLLQSRDVSDGFWLMPSTLLSFIHEMTTGRQPLETLLIIYVPTMALTIWTLVKHWRRLGITALVLLVPVIAHVVSVAWHPIYLSRALIAPALVLVLLWSVSVVQFQRWLKILFFGWLLLSITTTYTNQREPTMRSLFQSCEGRTVYTTSTHMAIAALYYAAPGAITFEHGDGIAQTLSREAKISMGFVLQDGFLPAGRYCYILQWSSVFTIPSEALQAAIVKAIYQPQIEFIEADMIIHYERMVFDVR